MLVPVEWDEDGNILDGHHRKESAIALGKEYPTVVRRCGSEQEKQEHVIKLDLARRQLEAWEWGKAFKVRLQVKGVERGHGSNQGEHSATVAECGQEVGVSERTARHRMAQDDLLETLDDDLRQEVKNRKLEV